VVGRGRGGGGDTRQSARAVVARGGRHHEGAGAGAWPRWSATNHPPPPPSPPHTRTPPTHTLGLGCRCTASAARGERGRRVWGRGRSTWAAVLGFAIGRGQVQYLCPYRDLHPSLFTSACGLWDGCPPLSSPRLFGPGATISSLFFVCFPLVISGAGHGPRRLVLLAI